MRESERETERAETGGEKTQRVPISHNHTLSHQSWVVLITPKWRNASQYKAQWTQSVHASAADASLRARACTPGHRHAPSSTICNYPAIIQACTSTTARHWAGVLLTAMVLSCSATDSAALLLLEFRPAGTSVVFITYSCNPGPGHGGPEDMVARLLLPAASKLLGQAAAKRSSLDELPPQNRGSGEGGRERGVEVTADVLYRESHDAQRESVG